MHYAFFSEYSSVHSSSSAASFAQTQFSAFSSPIATTMAPRGRPRKGTTRTDAAIDAMKTYGFEEVVVKRTLKELLEVYGADGWPFIEAHGYKELIEEILRAAETSLGKNSDKDEKNEGETTLPETSNAASQQICSEVGDFAPEAEDTVVKSPSSSICNDENNTDIQGDVPLTNEDTNDMNAKGKEKASENPENKMDSQSISAVHPSPSSSSKPQVDASPTEPPKIVTLTLPRKRFPCYGWIDSDDEEEANDLIQLSPVDPAKRPAPFAKRQSRWDVTPGKV